VLKPHVPGSGPERVPASPPPRSSMDKGAQGTWFDTCIYQTGERCVSVLMVGEVTLFMANMSPSYSRLKVRLTVQVGLLQNSVELEINIKLLSSCCKMFNP
jgi:hypothetical protein